MYEDIIDWSSLLQFKYMSMIFHILTCNNNNIVAQRLLSTDFYFFAMNIFLPSLTAWHFGSSIFHMPVNNLQFLDKRKTK